MKAGFKPKLWTKKEWLDAGPSDKTRGAGIESALEAWQKHCTTPFNDMSVDQAVQAAHTAHKLSEALTKASKACDLKAQKETLMGIHEYKKRADDYCKLAKLAAAAQVAREKYIRTFKTVKDLEADPGASVVFEAFAKSPQVGIWSSVHTLRLFAQKKFDHAVKLYGGNGQSSDFNIPDKHGIVLVDTFVRKIRHDQQDIIKAIEVCAAEQAHMLSDATIVPRLKATAAWAAHVANKYPIKECALS